MNNALTIAPLLAAALVLPGGTAEFDEFEVFIEINATDGDAGLQGKLDGGPWEKAKVIDEDGHTIWTLNPQSSLGSHGAAEVQWESNEPKFSTTYTILDFLAIFPEGDFEARGRALDGTRLSSTAELTHDIPAGPEITFPEEDEDLVLDGENVTVTWDEVEDDYVTGGELNSDVVLYIVVVEYEDEDDETQNQQLEIQTPPDVFMAEIPADFLKPDREYKFEVGVREESGNQTFTELEVCTVSE